MKIEMTQSHYADATGFKLVGAGEHDVSDERGRYLVDTFPAWFKAVEGEEPPKPAKPVSKMNKDELVALAGELGLEVTDEMKTNKDLQEAIKAHQEQQ